MRTKVRHGAEASGSIEQVGSDYAHRIGERLEEQRALARAASAQRAQVHDAAARGVAQVAQLGAVVVVLVGRVGHRAAHPRRHHPRQQGGGRARAHLGPQGLHLGACGREALREARVGGAVEEERLGGVRLRRALAPLLLEVAEAAVRAHRVEAVTHEELGRHEARVPQLRGAVRGADRVDRRPARLCGAALLGLREELPEHAQLHERRRARGVA